MTKINRQWRQRMARARSRPNIDVIWQNGLAGWHPARAGLANECDAAILRRLYERAHFDELLERVQWEEIDDVNRVRRRRRHVSRRTDCEAEAIPSRTTAVPVTPKTPAARRV